MKNFLLGLSVILALFILQKYMPKTDLSHVPKNQKNLVHFAQGAGF